MKKKAIIKASRSTLDMLQAFKDKLNEIDSCDTITSAESTYTEISGEYIQSLMEGVADDCTDMNLICSWDDSNEDVVITCTSMNSDSVYEFTVPKSDLSGDIYADQEYIVTSISEEVM